MKDTLVTPDVIRLMIDGDYLHRAAEALHRSDPEYSVGEYDAALRVWIKAAVDSLVASPADTVAWCSGPGAIAGSTFRRALED